MKLGMRIILFLFSILLIGGFVADTYVSAGGLTEYKILDRKLKDNKKYIWTIEFNQDVDVEYLTKENIYIVNKDGNKLNNINIITDKNIVRLKNSYDYRINEEYTIVIEENLKSTKKINLAKAIKFPFMIRLDRPVAPNSPKSLGRPSSSTIKLEEIKGAEYSIYSIDDILMSELKWQDSNVFVDLKPNKFYRFVARIKETSNNLESDISLISEPIQTNSDSVTVTFVSKVSIGDMIPFGTAKVETNVPNAYSYELIYKLSGGAKEVTPRTVIDVEDQPLFRYTEYIDVNIYDNLGRLIQQFINVKLQKQI
ncbi:hypothetical protein [Tissierella pigra]|uniref:SbsA Ig-like domain-containing protein n=1 Tax=Tissierella pigra TaxID=2607614 RepID=A0A6N7XS90_9FIRM|nr:hypothetical protein [Tissierella pigra]MSU00627.1 hypothetical protein [Tissierella pigra]